MTDARLRERRFRPPDPALKPGSHPCRVCLRIVDVAPEHIEKTMMYVYVRCPHCGGSFPIRHSDVEAFPDHETSLT
jgi:DNA-directed RNA polymerase subunit RPC12/RpoP